MISIQTNPKNWYQPGLWAWQKLISCHQNHHYEGAFHPMTRQNPNRGCFSFHHLISIFLTEKHQCEVKWEGKIMPPQWWLAKRATQCMINSVVGVQRQMKPVDTDKSLPWLDLCTIKHAATQTHHKLKTPRKKKGTKNRSIKRKGKTLIQQSAAYGKDLHEGSKLLMFCQQLWQVLTAKNTTTTLYFYESKVHNFTQNQIKNTGKKSKSGASEKLVQGWIFFTILVQFWSQEQRKSWFITNNTHLSTSGVLLIWGEAALAGEKFGLYKPDMALHFFFPFFFFLKDWKKTKPQKKKGGGLKKGGFSRCSSCRRKGETQHHQYRGVRLIRRKTKKGGQVSVNFTEKGKGTKYCLFINYLISFFYFFSLFMVVSMFSSFSLYIFLVHRLCCEK